MYVFVLCHILSIYHSSISSLNQTHICHALAIYQNYTGVGISLSKAFSGILPQRSRGRDPLEAAIWHFEEFNEFNIQLHIKRNNAPAKTFTISSLVKWRKAGWSPVAPSIKMAVSEPPRGWIQGVEPYRAQLTTRFLENADQWKPGESGIFHHFCTFFAVFHHHWFL